MRNLLLTLCALFALSLPARADSDTIREGDCWSYATRRGEESSFVVIRKITVLANGKVIAGISLAGLKVKAPRVPGGVLTEVTYLPVEGEALQKVLRKKLTHKTPAMAWEKEHAAWWENYGSKGQTGATALPLDEVVKNLELSLSSQR